MKSINDNRLIVSLALVWTCVLTGANVGDAVAADCDGFWNYSTPLPGTRQMACAGVHGDTIYVFGDSNCSSEKDSVLIYDLALGTWGSGHDMITGRGAAAAALHDGKFYIFGGNNSCSNSYPKANEEYDPGTDTWALRADLPATHGRQYLTAVTVGESIYVMGGSNSYDGVYDDNLVYHPASDSWSTGPALPRPRSEHAAVELDGKIYLVGGFRGSPGCNYTTIPEVDVFDPSTGIWSQAAPLPTPRLKLTAVTHNGKIYALGGEEFDGCWPGNKSVVVEEYDPILECWKNVTPLLTPRSLGCSVEANRLVYFIGGLFDGSALDEMLEGYPLPVPSGVFGDLDDNGIVDQADLNLMRALLDRCYAVDGNGDGAVDTDDFLEVLTYWGACPE